MKEDEKEREGKVGMKRASRKKRKAKMRKESVKEKRKGRMKNRKERKKERIQFPLFKLDLWSTNAYISRFAK